MRNQVLDSSYSYGGTLGQITPPCLSQLCIALPTSTFGDVSLVAWNLLWWSVCRIGIGTTLNLRFPLTCPHPGERVYRHCAILPRVKCNREGCTWGFHTTCNVFMLYRISKANIAQGKAVIEWGGSWVFTVILYAFLYFGNISWRTKSTQMSFSGQQKTASFLPSLILEI